MLYIFGGLPGTGKSTLSSALARQRSAFYLGIDTIEQAMRNAGTAEIGSVGYAIAYRVATVQKQYKTTHLGIFLKIDFTRQPIQYSTFELI